MEINITLIVVILAAVYLMCSGYKRGFAKEVSGMIALAAALLALALGFMLYSSYKAGEVVNVVYSVIFLAIAGGVYGVVRFVLKSAKLISHLPVIHFLDKLLGIGAGAIEALLIAWLIFTFCVEYNPCTLTDYVCKDIQNSAILRLIYQYNFLVR